MVEGTRSSSDLGLRFVRALAAKDGEALNAVLDPQVQFRGLTPSRTWEATSPAGVADVVLGSWFQPHDHIRETLETDTDPVADRERLHYRFRVENDEGEVFLVDQHGYYDAVDGRITRMSLMCAGFRPWPY